MVDGLTRRRYWWEYFFEQRALQTGFPPFLSTQADKTPNVQWNKLVLRLTSWLLLFLACSERIKKIKTEDKLSWTLNPPSLLLLGETQIPTVLSADHLQVNKVLVKRMISIFFSNMLISYLSDMRTKFVTRRNKKAMNILEKNGLWKP